MLIARIIVDTLLIVLLVSTSSGKLRNLPSSVEIRDSLRIGPGMWKTIGLAEVAGIVGLIAGVWVPGIGLAASIGIAVLMLGAVAFRLRARQRDARWYALDAIVLAVAVLQIVLHGLAL